MKTHLEERSLEPTGEFATTIRDFRAAVTHVADRESARPVSADWLAPARRRRRWAQHNMMLAWAALALLCLALLPLSPSEHPAIPHPAIAVQSVAPPPESDNALLEQVDTDVSESVPSPLAPLADLETWNSESTTASASNTSSRSSANGSALNSTENKNVAH
jgi:hypothetical protein